MEALEGQKEALLLVDFQENPSDQEIIFNFNKPFLYDELVVKLYKLIFNKVFLISYSAIYVISFIFFVPTVYFDAQSRYLIPFYIDAVAFLFKVYYIDLNPGMFDQQHHLPQSGKTLLAFFLPAACGELRLDTNGPNLGEMER